MVGLKLSKYVNFKRFKLPASSPHKLRKIIHVTANAVVIKISCTKWDGAMVMHGRNLPTSDVQSSPSAG
jgi:hypothetical protein